MGVCCLIKNPSARGNWGANILDNIVPTGIPMLFKGTKHQKQIILFCTTIQDINAMKATQGQFKY